MMPTIASLVISGWNQNAMILTVNFVPADPKNLSTKL
jgi:hypothetical protein